MGTPVTHLPVDSGNNCSSCTPDLWADGETPLYVYVTFSGITGCGRSPHDPPNGQTFKCTQSDANYCLWVYDGPVWRVEFHAKRIGHDYSFVVLTDEFGWAFFSGTGDICPQDLTLIENDQAACILMYAGAHGHALVTYLDIASVLIIAFLLQPGPELMLEFFVCDDTDIVIKFCNKSIHTNICVKLPSA